MKGAWRHCSRTGRNTARPKTSGLFPNEAEIRERLGGIARYYGNLIGCRYGEPFVVKETMRVDDIMNMGVKSF